LLFAAEENVLADRNAAEASDPASSSTSIRLKSVVLRRVHD